MTIKTPAPPIPDEIDRAAAEAADAYVRKAAPEVIATATAQRWEPAEVLRVLLAEEAAGRDQTTIGMRRARAGCRPARRSTRGTRRRRRSRRRPSKRCRTLEWIGRAEELCVCGPSGTGKSHLVEALGHLAIDRGKTVAWHTLERLAVMLRRHRADDSVDKAIGRLIRAD